MKNYNGLEVSDEDISNFRKRIKDSYENYLNLIVKEWNTTLLEITENRKSLFTNGVRTLFYSWCGDWVTKNIKNGGCSHGLALNRQELNNGKWIPGVNLTMMQAWAGDKGALLDPNLKHRFDNDPSAGKSWHPWDEQKDVCIDGYEPQLCDVIFTNRKGGGHTEFWVSRDGHMLTVSAGAQYEPSLGICAAMRTKDLATTDMRGIMDISALCSDNPY